MPLPGWLNFRAITDTTGGSLSGAVCKLTLTSANFDFSLAKSDGSDIRIYDETGTAVLPMWLMDYDPVGQTATVYYKATLTSNTHTLYYGNAGASSVSNFASVFTHGSGFDADWGDLTTHVAGATGAATRFAGPTSVNDSRNYLFWRLQESPMLSITDLNTAGVSNPGGIYTGLREFNLVRDVQNRIKAVNGKYYITFSRRPSANTSTIDGWRAESTSKYGPWSNFTQLYTTGTEHLNYPSSVLQVGSTFNMFLTFGWTNGGSTSPGLVVKLRTSTDLTSWSAASTVLSPGVFNDQGGGGACTDIGNPWVIQLADGTYMMTVEGQNLASNSWACYGATSPDLLVWTPLNSGNPLIRNGPTSSWDQFGVANPKIFQMPDHSFVIEYNGSDENVNWDWQLAWASSATAAGPYAKNPNNPIAGHTTATYGVETAHFSYNEDGSDYYHLTQRFNTTAATAPCYAMYTEQRQGGLLLRRATDLSDAAIAGVMLASGTFTAESRAVGLAHRAYNASTFYLSVYDSATVPNATTVASWAAGRRLEITRSAHDAATPGDLQLVYWDTAGTPVRHFWTGLAWSTTSTFLAADYAREVVTSIQDDGTNYILKANYADDGSSIGSASIAKTSVGSFVNGRALVIGDPWTDAGGATGTYLRYAWVRPYVATEPALTLGSLQFSPATTYTLTAPTPASGYTNNASGAFTVSPNGSFTGTITITPSGGGLSTPIVLNWFASAVPQTFTITPTAAGTVTLSAASGGALTDPSTVTYTATAQTLTVVPTTFYSSVPAPATFTGVGTTWRTNAPTLTVTGTAAPGTSIGSVVVASDTSLTAIITPGTTLGTMTFHDSTTSATAVVTVAAPPAPSSHLSSTAAFDAGLLGSVGYTILRSDGSTYAARSTLGVFAIGTVGYAATMAIPVSGSFIVLWDDGAGHQDFETITPPGVEPPSAVFPGGMNQNQALAEILAVVTGDVSGFGSPGGGNLIYLAPDGITTRMTGTVDRWGNRTAITLTPPT